MRWLIPSTLRRRSAKRLGLGLVPSKVTRQVSLALDVNGFTRDPFGGTRAGFSGTAEINRQDFGITTNIPMDGGGVVIGDRIQIFIEVEAILQPAEVGAGA